jgi:hypothetical protein
MKQYNKNKTKNSIVSPISLIREDSRIVLFSADQEYLKSHQI